MQKKLWAKRLIFWLKLCGIPYLIFTIFFCCSPSLKLSMIITAQNDPVLLQEQKQIAFHYSLCGYFLCLLLVSLLCLFYKKYGGKNLARCLVAIFIILESLAAYIFPELPSLGPASLLFSHDSLWTEGIIYSMTSRYEFFLLWIWEWIIGLLIFMLILKGWRRLKANWED